jgi:hypothetical protein
MVAERSPGQPTPKIAGMYRYLAEQVGEPEDL